MIYLGFSLGLLDQDTVKPLLCLALGFGNRPGLVAFPLDWGSHAGVVLRLSEPEGKDCGCTQRQPEKENDIGRGHFSALSVSNRRMALMPVSATVNIR